MITGRELARKVLDHVIEHPEQHSQGIWIDFAGGQRGNYCGTTACLAGWAVVFNAEDGESIDRTLRRLAGELTVEAEWEDVGVALLSAEPVRYGVTPVPQYTDLQKRIRDVFYSGGSAVQDLADAFGPDVPEA